jgi:hypothetical protein
MNLKEGDKIKIIRDLYTYSDVLINHQKAYGGLIIRKIIPATKYKPAYCGFSGSNHIVRYFIPMQDLINNCTIIKPPKKIKKPHKYIFNLKNWDVWEEDE